MKLQELVERIKVKKDKEDKINEKFKELDKKKLTQEQRLDRIEELLGITD